jgi:hypothetical protein
MQRLCRKSASIAISKKHKTTQPFYIGGAGNEVVGVRVDIFMAMAAALRKAILGPSG